MRIIRIRSIHSSVEVPLTGCWPTVIRESTNPQSSRAHPTGTAINGVVLILVAGYFGVHSFSF
jgi:hypothetical protein